MKKILITILCLVIIHSSVWAWGRTGHTIVISIAYQHLTESNKAILNRYLDGLSISDAASWMDDIRSDSKYSSLTRLHFMNVPKGQAYNPTTNNGENIATEVNRIIGVLAKPQGITDEAIKIDLYELLHLIGDLHQPLHVGYGEDKGGNDFQVQFLNNGTNLHKVWDSGIIDRNKAFLDDDLNIPTDVSTDMDITAWVNESRSYLDGIYPSNHKINEAYITTNRIVIKQQLYKAGIRLAAILNKYLSGLNPDPIFVHEAVGDVPTINIDSVNNYIGRTVKVCGLVYGVKHDEGKPAFLNVGADYPYAPLTVVIFPDALQTFSKQPEKLYKKRNVCVTGKIVIYKSMLEIVVKKEDEIEVR